MGQRSRHHCFLAAAACALLQHPVMAGEGKHKASGVIPQATAKSQKEWLAVVHHYNVGDCRIRFTADAVNITESSGGIMVSSAPQWEICCYRKTEKLEWSTPLSKPKKTGGKSK